MYIQFKKSYFIRLLCLMLVSSSLMYANADEAFVKASKDFFDKGRMFSGESKQLMVNTQQVDKELLDFERALMIPHKTSQALRTLNQILNAVNEGLMIAEQVPETREQAQKLRASLEQIHTPVAKASKSMDSIDKKIVPLLKAAHKAEVVSSKLVIAENTYRNMGISYVKGVGALTKCKDNKIIIKILNESTVVYKEMDIRLKQINDAYASARKVPEDTMKEIIKEIEKIQQIEKPVMELTAKLKPLYDQLKELRYILDKRIGIRPGYPCGPKICFHEVPFPCGVKTCSKHVAFVKVYYPCGTKMCSQKTPYPCGIKTCSVNISMSVADAIKGASKIEHKIESVLSSTIYSALKTVGIGSLVHDLEKQADNIIRPILSKLHLNIDTRLPSLNISLETKLLDKGIVDIDKFEKELEQILSNMDIKGAKLSPYVKKLEKLNGEIESVLKSPICEAK